MNDCYQGAGCPIVSYGNATMDDGMIHAADLIVDGGNLRMEA